MKNTSKTTKKTANKATAPKANKVSAKAAAKAPKTKKAGKAAKKAAAPKQAQVSRKDTVLALVARPNGATLAEIMTETGWQAHSVRGLISTLAKKGTTIESTRSEAGERTYKS